MDHDDWLFGSISEYTTFNAYDLPIVPAAIAARSKPAADDGSIQVLVGAATTEGRSYEMHLMELTVARDNDAETFDDNDVDFVAGGFSLFPLHSACFLSETALEWSAMSVGRQGSAVSAWTRDCQHDELLKCSPLDVATRSKTQSDTPQMSNLSFDKDSSALDAKSSKGVAHPIVLNDTVVGSGAPGLITRLHGGTILAGTSVNDLWTCCGQSQLCTHINVQGLAVGSNAAPLSALCKVPGMDDAALLATRASTDLPFAFDLRSIAKVWTPADLHSTGGRTAISESRTVVAAETVDNGGQSQVLLLVREASSTPMLSSAGADMRSASQQITSYCLLRYDIRSSVLLDAFHIDAEAGRQNGSVNDGHNLSTTFSQGDGSVGAIEYDVPKIRCCRWNSNGVSISGCGLNRGVAIYDLASKQTKTKHTDVQMPTPKPHLLSPLHVHQGHVAGSLLVDHIWHPKHPNTLVSSDSQGGFQVWSSIKTQRLVTHAVEPTIKSKTYGC